MKALLAHLNRLDRYAESLLWLARGLTRVVERDGIMPEGMAQLCELSSSGALPQVERRSTS